MLLRGLLLGREELELRAGGHAHSADEARSGGSPWIAGHLGTVQLGGSVQRPVMKSGSRIKDQIRCVCTCTVRPNVHINIY